MFAEGAARSLRGSGGKKTSLLTSLGISSVLCLSACAEIPPASVAQVSPAGEESQADLPELTGSSGTIVTPETPRRVGDRFVHRFHGSYRKQPITLIEEVVAREGDVFVVDYELSEGERTEQLRVRLSVRSERLVSVSRRDGAREIAVPRGEYESFLARTLFVPDENTGRLTESSQTCLVGTRELDCEISKYRVYVGEREADLVVSRSAEVGRDISGEIVAVDGTILYRAELIEMQRGEPILRETSSASAARTP